MLQKKEVPNAHKKKEIEMLHSLLLKRQHTESYESPFPMTTTSKHNNEKGKEEEEEEGSSSNKKMSAETRGSTTVPKARVRLWMIGVSFSLSLLEKSSRTMMMCFVDSALSRLE